MRKTKKLLSLLTAVTMAASAFSAIVVPASADTEFAPTATMTYVDYDNADTAMGYIATGDTARAGYNKISSGSIGFVNTSWGENKIAYIKVDASEVVASGESLVSATLSLDVSGSSDSKRTCTYGVGTTAYTAWDNTLTYNIADTNGMFAITTVGDTYTTTTKAASTFETATFDIADAVSADEDGIITLAVYETAAAGGYIKNPTVAVTTTNATQYTVTIKVVDEDNVELKDATTEEVIEGTSYTPTYDASFNLNGNKYTYVSGGDAVTITGDTTITLVYSARALVDTTYTIVGTLGEATKTLTTGTVTEDSTVRAGYPKYVIGDDGVLYTVAAQTMGSYYHVVEITGTQEDQTVTVAYTADTSVTPVYYAEMEDVLTNNGVSNADIRCSNAAGGDLDDSQTIATLSAGTYVVTTAVWGGSNKGDSYNSTYVLTAGDTTAASATTTGSLVTVTGDEFTLTEDTDLVLTKTVTGSSAACIDYILITGTGTATSDDDDEDDPSASTEPTDPSATDTPIPEEEATGTPIPEEEATGTPIPEEEATGTPIPEEEATTVPGTVLYEQDYDDATAVDWVSPNYQDMFSLIADANGGQMLQADHSVSSPNSRGAYVLFGGLEAGSQYVLEFDLGMQGGTNRDQETVFAVMGSDYSYSINDGINSGYALKLSAEKGVSDMSITNSSATVPYDGTIYHYSLIVDGTVAYLTVTNGEETVVEQQTIPVNGDGGLAGLYYRSGRYTSIMQIDNIVVRTPYEDEVPESNTHAVTVNTTRYAVMKLSDDTAYYADVNGTIDIPLVDDGTVLDYTLSKVGYTSVTGSVTVDEDKTIDAPLTLAEDYADYIYIESEFGNADGAYVSAAASRSDSISLGSATLPELSNISVSLSFDGFGSYAGQQKTWAIVTDAGNLVGLQMSDDGMVAWTGWTGSAAMSAYDDVGAYTNGATLAAEYPTGNFTVDFVVDTANKAITVAYGDTSVSLTYDIDATAVTGLATGLYRYYGAMNTYEIAITEPDATYMILSGDTAFAKVSGQTVTREYTRTESVITPDETFTWTISPAADGISVADGVVSVTDAATPGEYVLTATGTTEKTASLTITVADYSTVTATVDGPTAYTVGQTGTYSVTSLVDAYEDDVIDLFTPSYASSDTSVITIDAATGVAEAVGNGTATISITVGNPGVEAVETIDVTVDEYYITADATGDSTMVDMTSIYGKADSYLVTTSMNGVLVNQTVITDADIVVDGETETKYLLASDGYMYVATYDETGALASLTMTEVSEGDEVAEAAEGTSVFYWDANQAPITIITASTGAIASVVYIADTTGANKVEIAPIYTTTIGTVMEVPADTYNVTATVNNGARTDLYVNDQMLLNNINQGSDNWTVGRTLAETAEYEANDIVIAEGYAKFNLQDDKSSGTTVTGITFVKAPSIVDRAQRIYVIGDSLVAKYYGDAPEGSEGLVRTGWGDVLANYIADDVNVTNLGNSGAWATGMLSDAFTNVKASAQAGDIVIWESGYNDRSYSTVDDMKAAITEAANVCAEMGVDFYVVTPNASRHDYSASVVWSSSIRELAEEQNMKLIDLCADSFELLSGLYGDDATVANDVLITYYNNSGDTLHSSYNAANLWAAIVAQGLYDAGLTDVVNTTYSYTFNDGTQDVTAQVTAE